jgi:Leucine rich repeat
MTQLATLELKNNQLSGTLPPSMGNLASLVTLSCRSNRLSGVVGEQAVEGLHSLSSLDLSDNQLSGSLAFLQSAALQALADVNLRQNAFDELVVLRPGLVSLDVSHNQLRGDASFFFPLVSDPYLRSVDASHNRLSGYLTCLREVLEYSLQHFDEQHFDLVLSYNEIRGSLPDLSNLDHIMRTFLVDHNRLSGLLPPDACLTDDLRGNNFTCPMPTCCSLPESKCANSPTAPCLLVEFSDALYTLPSCTLV